MPPIVFSAWILRSVKSYFLSASQIFLFPLCLPICSQYLFIYLHLWLQLGINYTAKGKCFLSSSPSLFKCCAGLFLPAASQMGTARGAIYVSLGSWETSRPRALFWKKVTGMSLLRAVLLVKWVWACPWHQLRKEQRVCRGQRAEQHSLPFPAPWFWLGSTGWIPLPWPAVCMAVPAFQPPFWTLI